MGLKSGLGRIELGLELERVRVGAGIRVGVEVGDDETWDLN